MKEIQKWLLNQRLEDNSKIQNEKILDSYKGYKKGDTIYFLDSSDSKKNNTGIFEKAVEKKGGYTYVHYKNKANKEDHILGYFLISKDSYEKYQKEEAEKALQKEKNKQLRIQKMKATMAAKKEIKEIKTQTAILNKEIKIPERVTLTFINKLLKPYELFKTDTKNYYSLVDSNGVEYRIYFTKTMKILAELIIENGVDYIIENYKY